MNVPWLKSLAARLRDVLVDHGIVVTHGQTLDLVAAIVGLRDWPEVSAFPDKVEACRFDHAAAGRLSRRAEARHGVTLTAEQWMVSLKISEFRDRPRDDGLERLIVCPGDSGAGHLKHSRIANFVIALDRGDEFVWGPVPLGDTPAEFFRRREAAYAAGRETLWAWLRAAPALETWNKVVATCERYERVELWSDPEPRHLLLFLRAATWFAQDASLRPKLHVVHAETPLGERSGEDLATEGAVARPLDDAELGLIRTLWNALRQRSPEAWAGMVSRDLSAIPAMSRTVRLLLAELPSVDRGVSATQLRILRELLAGDLQANRIVALSGHDGRVCDYWTFGRVLVDLARASTPAITGIPDDTFDMGMHDEPSRHERFMRSTLSLTGFGRAVAEGRADFAARNVIDRWWGGTHLTNANLWRWDADRGRLIAPG